jgi:1-phosphofructokinase family hexose kinase
MIEYNDLSELSPFLIITPNPAIDRILVVPALQIGQAQRVQESRIAAGGKGLNVGRAMKSLGVTASILAPLGGFTGQQATHLARREGLALSDVPIGDETRVCTLVVDLATQQVTVLNEIGPQLTATEWVTFEQAILDNPATWHLFCGSLPPGVEASTLAALIRALRIRGKRVLIDTSGAALAMAITAQPDVVKVNGEELGGLFGDHINNEHTAYQAAIRLHREGIEQVIVTLGADGAIGVNRTTVVKATPPAVPVQNPIGCGDSFFAGLAIALERGQPLATALRLATACGAADAQTLAPGHIAYATVNALAEKVHLRYW